MNQEPKFAAAISESQRLDAQTAATTAAANAARETTLQRLDAVELEQLTHLVFPLLEQARAALAAAGIVACSQESAPADASQAVPATAPKESPTFPMDYRNHRGHADYDHTLDANWQPLP